MIPDKIQKLLNSNYYNDIILGMELSKSFFRNAGEWNNIVWQPLLFRVYNNKIILCNFTHEQWKSIEQNFWCER